MNETAATQVDHLQKRYNGEFDYPLADTYRLQKAISFIGTGKRVLDVGSYDGQLSAQIQSAGNEVVAMDASSDALQVAQKRGLSTIQGDAAQRWPVDTDSFDTVFAGEIIEHIVDTDFFLQECRRVIRPHGDLIITTPNLASLGRRLLLLLGFNPMTDTALRANQAGHVRYFVTESIRELLRENGFRVKLISGDFISFSNSGRGSAKLANLFPRLSRSLIIHAVAVPSEPIIVGKPR